MALDIIGFLVLKNALTVALRSLDLRTGLGKPKSPTQFWSRFKEQLLEQSQFNQRSD